MDRKGDQTAESADVADGEHLNHVLCSVFGSDEKPGSQGWWENVRAEGTPLILAQDDTETELLFLWQYSDITDDPICQVYIDINGVTDHHSFDMAKLTHWEGTDIWFYKTKVSCSWRGSYSFMPVTQALVQPVYQGTYPEKRQQHREWLRKIFPLSLSDSLSKNGLAACEWGRSKTPLAMPQALAQAEWSGFDSLAGSAHKKPDLQLTWTSKMLANERDIWFYSTARSSESAALPLVLVLDGRFWSQLMPLFDALSAATDSGRVPPALYVFIDEVSGEQRSEELGCNALFWEAIVQELLPLTAGYFPVTEDASRTVVTGQSLGGLSAMYAGLHFPERFGGVVCQSGSFWWPDFSLVKPPGDYSPPETDQPLSEMSQQVCSGLGRHVNLNIFMEVGSGEDIMVDLSRDLYRQLDRQNHRLQFRTYDGGHERLCWRGGLIDGLAYVFNSEF